MQTIYIFNFTKQTGHFTETYNLEPEGTLQSANIALILWKYKRRSIYTITQWLGA
jgi:hypothetical protein